ncbi:hypothetical protein [Vibrio harveyi]|uniref:hypothetical protein n=1 Tax=Vibrio harveyi TaxID=669 RepID=UPI0018F275B1|nr:hypothetical protein [Vibrio harveyi]
MKKLFAIAAAVAVSFSALAAGMYSHSYVDGMDRVCVYTDGSRTVVGASETCPMSN